MRKGSGTSKKAQSKPAQVNRDEQQVWAKKWNVPWKTEDVLIETGNDLFRPCKPEEVVPNLEQYYFQPRFRPGNFYLQSFSHLVDWKTVVELCENGYLFVRKDFKL
jgi:hypothetical protein